ncbi:ATP-dependent DNA ligase [Proteobacteria bacterium 005FR1]|nr:ATP-dependent DNA ligase [Proteobacteria bacterium 005FR1]
MASRTAAHRDDALATYNAKRDFRRTGEPRGRVSSSPGSHSFVIQKHAARKLHFDFRLELDGVLKSWAVTRGPSLDPKDKRLAVRTEDHPVDYQYFEGSIPRDEYGGGEMLIWDRGAWIPRNDPHDGLKRGVLKFELEGERLRGGFALVRMGKTGSSSGKQRWLLVKEDDSEADTEIDPLTKWTDSVASHRCLDDIAESEHTSASSEKTTPTKTSRAGLAKSNSAARQADKRREQNASATTLAGVRLSSPDKVLYPTQGTTKRAMAEYLLAVQEPLLRHIARRPLTLVRCPRGRSSKCFFQKHHGRGLPASLKSVDIVENSGKPAEYVYVEDDAGLVGTAQVGTLELHIWGSTIDRLEQPDRLIFDLDPDEALSFGAVKRAAAHLRRRLKGEGLESFAMLTGGKGIHVVVPLEPAAGGPDWQTAKAFARGFAEALARDDPKQFVATASKAKRKGKIYIDWLRNERGATAIAPYASRAREYCPIATPVSWRELPRLRAANVYTIANIRRRLSQLNSDPWEGYFSVKQGLSEELISKYSAR